MPTDNANTRTRPGRCPTHGEVAAQKEIPQFKFPFVIVFLVRRALAALRPYRCPTCGAKAA
ncbi:MAG TPA: hypothetical protein VK272_00165 [Solirubrobacteraceae bacterium]|nr:hypothetical protein [Solirubrobacteraceae bacterium]